jgi:hypothetical protein
MRRSTQQQRPHSALLPVKELVIILHFKLPLNVSLSVSPSPSLPVSLPIRHSVSLSLFLSFFLSSKSGQWLF